MRYTVTIKDNKTNETLIDEQADCIIGALDLEDSIKRIMYSNTATINALQCAFTAIETAEPVINEITGRIKEENND